MQNLKMRLRRFVHLARQQNLNYRESVNAVRRQFLLDVLADNQYNQCHAARELGMHRNTFSRTAAQLDINVRQLVENPGVRKTMSTVREAPPAQEGRSA